MDERRNVIEVWRAQDFPHLELRQGFAVARPVPRHWHEEYQLCLIQSGSGELKYRSKSFLTPPAGLFIVHPGEVHSNRANDNTGCSYRDLFVGAELMRRAAAQVQGKEQLPFFQTVVVFDRDVIRQYLELHFAFEHPSTNLERQALLLNLLASLIARFAEDSHLTRSSGSERRSVSRACDYLVEHHAENISLENLARIAALSPFHFSRVFSAQFGMPPHQFQTLVRVSRAKKLLRQGWSIPQAASHTGFFDQSHLNRHFKRLVGVTPGQYQSSSKNVQDAALPQY
ncbi:MAG TPA: AraC family transcriptional regulator [Pyrinomonadaceae bacterium]